MDNGFGLFTKRSRPEVFAIPGPLVKCQVAMRGLVPLFFKKERNAHRTLFKLPSDFRFGWTAPIPSIRFENQETLSFSFSLSNIILSFSTREEKEIEGKTRFLISEASIDRSLYSLSLRFPFPQYYFVAVSDPFTKQSR